MDVEFSERVRKVDVTAICDADKTARAMSSAIQSRSVGKQICAPAFTVRCRGDLFALLDAVETALPGEVIVVDGGGEELAFGGELFARAAMARGLAGIIVDGGYRDIGYVSTCPLPIFSRHVTPMAGTINRLGESRLAVSCGGVTVNPGDIVVADVEGIVVLDPQRADVTLEKAEAIKALEGKVVRSIEDGKTLVDCFNVDEHRLLLERNQPSTLQFTV